MRSPRIALKPRAAMGLRAWAALEGREPSEILEELVLSSLPPRIKELIDGEPEGPGSQGQWSLSPQETVSQGSREPESPGLQEPVSPAEDLCPEVREALAFIAEELRAGREPTIREVADAVKMTPVGISRKLGELGIYSQNTKRQMKAVRIYTRLLMPKIEAILKGEMPPC